MIYNKTSFEKHFCHPDGILLTPEEAAYIPDSIIAILEEELNKKTDNTE